MSSGSASLGTVTTPPHSIIPLTIGYPTPQSADHSRVMVGTVAVNSDASSSVTNRDLSSDQQHSSTVGLQLGASHHDSHLDSGSSSSSRGPSSWPGMDSVEYIQTGGYASAQFTPNHTAFIAYQPSNQHPHNQMVPPQPNNHDHILTPSSQTHMAQQPLFPEAHSTFHGGPHPAHPIPVSHTDSKPRPPSLLHSTFSISIPTPPHSDRRPTVRQYQTDEIMTANQSDHLDKRIPMSPSKHDQVPIAQAFRSKRLGMAHVDIDLGSPSPSGMFQNRSVQQASPTSSNQRWLNEPRKDMTSRSAPFRSFPSHRHSHSLGPAVAISPSQGERPQAEASMHTSAPVSPIETLSHMSYTSIVQLSAHRQLGQSALGHAPTTLSHQPQTPNQASDQSRQPSNQSIRSHSPSTSIASTSFASISPLGSARFHPDASFTSQDASTDGISNTASASASRASSISEEILAHDFSNGTLPPSMRMTKRKRKLLNIDRKRICDYQVTNPRAKQDAIAAKFGIERSTVSKILKQKEKWLAIDPSSECAKIAKHRTAKFPQVEDRLSAWADQMKQEGHLIQDIMIKQEALKIAKQVGLTVEKFKASGGWIEKFRERNQLPKLHPDPIDDEQGSPDLSDMGNIEADGAQQNGIEEIHPFHQQCMDVESEAVQSGTLHRPNGFPSVMAPPESQPAVKVESTPSDQMTPTSQKRQFDAIATTSVSDVSPLNSNMARMQFEHTAADGMQHGDPTQFDPNTGSDYTGSHGETQLHPHVAEQNHSATLAASFHQRGVTIAAGPPADGNQEHSFLAGLATLPERDAGSATKRRRAGTDGTRVDPTYLGQALDYRPSYSPAHLRQGTEKAAIEEFQFSAVSTVPGKAKETSALIRDATAFIQSQTVHADMHSGEGQGLATSASSAIMSEYPSGTFSPPRVSGVGSGRQNNCPGTSSPLSKSPNHVSGSSFADHTETDKDARNAHRPRSHSDPTIEHVERPDSLTVTAEQAQQSLEVVLRFLSEQPSHLVPSSHFVVFGHLQANLQQLIREQSRQGEGSDSSAKSCSEVSSPRDP